MNVSEKKSRPCSARRNPRHFVTRAAARRRVQTGFSIIEALIACLIFVFGFLPVLAVLLFSQRINQQAQIQAVAYNVARGEMEKLAYQSWSNCVTVADTPFDIPSALSGQLPYNVQLVGLYNVAATSSPTLHQVSVSVRWKNVTNGQSGNGPISEVRLSTLIAKQPNQ